jgi:hypothetical protein
MKPFIMCCDVHMMSATVSANAALMLLSTHALGAMHASEGVPAALAHQSEKLDVFTENVHWV